MSRLLAVVFALALALALVAMAPLGVAAGWLGLGRLGLSASAATGTVWSGRLLDARFRGVPLGDVAVGLQPLGLLTGTARLSLRTETANGVLVRGGGRTGIADASFRAPLSLFPSAVPLPGTLTAEGLSVEFRRGRCIRAGGKVSADVLQRSALLGEGGSVLTGAATCDGGALVLPLTGRTGAAGVELKLRIEGDGRYRMDTKVATADPRLSSVLSLAGFAPVADGRARTDQGRLWR